MATSCKPPNQSYPHGHGGYESELISQHTKAGLVATKAYGVNLGTKSNLREEELAKVIVAASEAQFRFSDDQTKDRENLIGEIKRDGYETDHSIATALNERGESTLIGLGRWYSSTVSRLIIRLGPNY